jgi:hypothetical protein
MESIVLTCPNGKIAGISDMDWEDENVPEAVKGPAFGINPAKQNNIYKNACRRQSTFGGSSDFSNLQCSE